MAHRLQYRRDTRENWLKYNPVLMEGEVGYETDTHHQKVGDGVSTYSELEYEVGVGNITQEMGDSETLVMSQKAVSEAIPKVVNDLTTGGADKALSAEMGKELNEKINSNTTLVAIGKNIFTKENSTPKVVIDENGEYTSHNNYNTTDYIKVEPSCNYKYLDSSGGFRNLLLYDGDKNPIIGSYTTNLTYFRTTPNTKYVRLSYRITATQNQLEKGLHETVYEEPTYKRLIDGDKISPQSVSTDSLADTSIYPGGKNLLNRDYEEKGFQLSKDGTLEPASTASTSEFIPVNYGDVIFWSGVKASTSDSNVISRFAIYDAYKNLVFFTTQSTGVMYDSYAIPRNVRYIRLTYRTANTNIQVEKGAQTEYEPFIPKRKLNASALGITVPNTDTPYLLNQWYGKNLTVDGDSITHDQGQKNYWQYVLRDKLEMNILRSNDFVGADGTTNFVGTNGVAGSRIAYGVEQNDVKYCIGSRYQYLDDNADLIIIAGGTNDWVHNGVDLGTMTDRTNVTFYGALHLLCVGLIEKFPSKQIAFMTPIKRTNYLDHTNKFGKTLEEYADAIIEVCGYYGIPVIDLFHELCMNPSIPIQKELYFADDTHPNTAGQKRMGDKVVTKVLGL